MKKMNENTKVTLTLKQLKRLVKEAAMYKPSFDVPCFIELDRQVSMEIQYDDLTLESLINELIEQTKYEEVYTPAADLLDELKEMFKCKDNAEIVDAIKRTPPDLRLFYVSSDYDNDNLLFATQPDQMWGYTDFSDYTDDEDEIEQMKAPYRRAWNLPIGKAITGEDDSGAFAFKRLK